MFDVAAAGTDELRMGGAYADKFSSSLDSNPSRLSTKLDTASWGPSAQLRRRPNGSEVTKPAIADSLTEQSRDVMYPSATKAQRAVLNTALCRLWTCLPNCIQ